MSGSVALLNQRVDLLMMTVMADREDLGYYAVATTLAAILNAVANSIAMPARNRVSRGDETSVARTTAGTMLIVLLLAIVVIAVLPILVSLCLGNEFLPAIPIMVLLLLMQVPLGGVVILTQTLIGSGRPGAPLGGEIAALTATVVLVCALFPTFGVVAAAVATGIGNVLSFAVLLTLVRRHVCGDPLGRFLFISPRTLVHLVRNRKEPIVEID
jgi:O-antigen/teichoic acid export membrane protein